eukprot:NODE_5467_length_650_cov_20.059273_g5303_i0.p1 GENE.NODE_5467_length_650_cov_20.059273_g5303_i0~~NODE_5467_length_650_cov_20.059273_g5303_i0.p1  ORF type:complete len:212 (-),score=67.50 NODE_5467_length_650_cov_20.059273_g5303_i0:15-581(-)
MASPSHRLPPLNSPPSDSSVAKCLISKRRLLTCLVFVCLCAVFISNLCILIYHITEMLWVAVIVRIYCCLFLLVLMSVELTPCLRCCHFHALQFLHPWVARGFVQIFVGLICASPVAFRSSQQVVSVPPKVIHMQCFPEAEGTSMEFARWFTGCAITVVAMAYIVLGMLGHQPEDPERVRIAEGYTSI